MRSGRPSGEQEERQTEDAGTTEATAAAPRVEVIRVESGWAIREDGAAVQHTYEAREKAVAQARSLASERDAVLIIFDEEGQIEETQDYGTMGTAPSPETDITGEAGTEATAKAEQRSMHRG